MDHFNLNKLAHFVASYNLYQYWDNSELVYTEGVHRLADKLKCYWLIDEIGRVIFQKLLARQFSSFYSIQLLVHSDCAAVITVGDGNNDTYFEHKINWTDCPIIGEPICFYLCESGEYYCLMLPSEY